MPLLYLVTVFKKKRPSSEPPPWSNGPALPTRRHCEHLQTAAAAGYTAQYRRQLVEMLRSGADLTATDVQGMTPLHHAVRYGHKDLVEYILKHGPPSLLDISDYEKGQTPLHKAASYQRRSICCMLVAAGAKVTSRDSNGNTPRLLSLKANDRDLADYLKGQEQYVLASTEENQETAV
ncbi:hypothetical protein Bbelb_383110 [Branchiostoma belcheri]|nr:hypothetical protein Bbelb_383110 [Branchiostoma belcheri]